MENLTYAGWGLIGEPQADVLVRGPSGPSLDVTGYSAADYWDGETFLGPDEHGIVPIYIDADGGQFPPEAKQYPHLA